MEVEMNAQSREDTTGRILYDVPCEVCQDHSSGKHYGIYACDGCAGFFKRSIRHTRQYDCKGLDPGQCIIDRRHRNQCRACRLRKCLEAGMNRDAVQHERGPRISTLRHQLASNMGAAPSVSIPVFNALPAMPLSSNQTGLLGTAFQPTWHFPTSSIMQPTLSQFHPAFYSSSTPHLNALAYHGSPSTSSSIVKHIKEVTAELVYKNVTWIKGVRLFGELPFPDQMQLLEESWKDLLLLGMAQCLMPINFTQLLIVYETENSNHPEMIAVIGREIHAMQDVLNQLYRLGMDVHEYEYLRAMAIFRTSSAATFSDEECTNRCNSEESSPNTSSNNSDNDVRCIIESMKVSSLHDENCTGLIAYVGRTYPHQPLRFQTIMSIMVHVGKVSATAIEEVFFRKDIGEASIVRAISSMYREH